jgi:septal ring factor EnvC (AmiA/AmiB activator)
LAQFQTVQQQVQELKRATAFDKKGQKDRAKLQALIDEEVLKRENMQITISRYEKLLDGLNVEIKNDKETIRSL